MNIEKEREAFEEWVSQFDTLSSQYQDMGADEYFIAGYQAGRAALQSQSLTVDDLAQEIRRVDGKHSLGAGALAEALMPFIQSALQSQDREDALEKAQYALMIAQAHAPCPLYAETIEAIDHARRVEGEGR